MGCSPWGLEELDMTKRLHFYFSLSCIGEGNGKPLQCSCLENPRDGGAWFYVSINIVIYFLVSCSSLTCFSSEGVFKLPPREPNISYNSLQVQCGVVYGQ